MTACLVPDEEGAKDRSQSTRDKLTGWRRYFEAALKQDPVLGSNHQEYMRHLRLRRDQEAMRREGVEPRSCPG